MKMNKMILSVMTLSLGAVISMDAWHIRCKNREVCQKEDDLKIEYKKKRADITHNKENAELDYKKKLEYMRDKKVKLNLDYKNGKMKRHEYQKTLADIDAEIDKLKNTHNKKMLDFKHEEKVAEIDYNEKKHTLKEER